MESQGVCLKITFPGLFPILDNEGKFGAASHGVLDLRELTWPRNYFDNLLYNHAYDTCRFIYQWE